MEVVLDVVQRVADGSDLVDIRIRDGKFEFLLHRHNHVDQIKRISVQIFDERSFPDYQGFVHAQLIDNNPFELFKYGVGCHHLTSLSAPDVGDPCARLKIVPRTPFTNRLEFSLPKTLASSTASLMAAFAGTVLLNRIS